ncbi:hypothetical protein ABEB36_008952 [Hypothenemus hampei]|uniref:Uncharacterized protein n=1 Tax=Hypothenemus hampei TaxID=57062 RepID=A0ABD1ENL2_HYPHA
MVINCDDGELIKVYELVPQAMNIIGLNKRDDPTKRRHAAKKYIYAFYMISSHDETQPETPPTSAAISPSLSSSPPPSSTISVEGSVDGPVTGSVDGIVEERIKKEKELPELNNF